MISLIPMRRDARYRVVPPPPFVPQVRPMRPEEYNWVIHSWTEGYKGSPCAEMPWAEYKALVVPTLRAALARPDTQVLVATNGRGWGVGWMAFARWPSIDAIHWVYTAHQYRRAGSRGLAPTGVMTALIDAFAPRGNVVYTHKARLKRKAQRADLWIADLLRERGATVSHVSYATWSR